jgi:hypothetical protein
LYLQPRRFDSEVKLKRFGLLVGRQRNARNKH